MVFLPTESNEKYFALLDDIIIEYGTFLFPGYDVTETMLFTVTRDADFAVLVDLQKFSISAQSNAIIEKFSK